MTNKCPEGDSNKGLTVCLYLKLKHGELDHSATTGSYTTTYSFHIFVVNRFWVSVGVEMFC